MMTSSGRWMAIPSMVAVNGSSSPTSPTSSMPSLGHRLAGQAQAHLRRLAHRLVVDDPAVRRTVHGHDEHELHVALAGLLAHEVEHLLATDGLGWRR